MKRLYLFAAIILFAAIPANAQQSNGFTPCKTSAQPGSLSVSGTSSNELLSTCGPSVIIYNITSQEAFYELGSNSSTTATTSSPSIPGNTFVILSVPFGQGTVAYLAAITASSTTTLRVVQGSAN